MHICNNLLIFLHHTNNMNKTELLVKLKQQTNMNIHVLKQAVDMFFDYISASLIKGDRVYIKGFGVFCLHRHNAHMGYNPQTGRKYFVSEKQLPYFRASSEMKKAMNAAIEKTDIK